MKLDIKGVFSMHAQGDLQSKTSSHSLSTSLSIEIRVFGLGLNEAGASSLNAQTMEDFSKLRHG